MPFSYTIVANRADEVLPDGSVSKYSAERFPAAPSAQPKVRLETQEENMATRSLKEDAPAELPQNILKKDTNRK